MHPSGQFIAAIGAILIREKFIESPQGPPLPAFIARNIKSYTREFNRANPAPILIKLASARFSLPQFARFVAVVLRAISQFLSTCAQTASSFALSMSCDPSLLPSLSETDVLTVSPLIDPAASTASSVQSPTMISGAPLTVSISKVLSDIDALPSPLCSPANVTTEPLVCASPLTERALRSQRRDALRAASDMVVTPSLDTVRSHPTLAESDVPARISNSCITLPFTPQRHSSIYDYRISAIAPRVTTLVANHPPSSDRVCPTRNFSPLAPLRASRSMSLKKNQNAPITF